MPTRKEIIDGGVDCLCVCLSITDSYKMELLRTAVKAIVEAAVMEAVEKMSIKYDSAALGTRVNT